MASFAAEAIRWGVGASNRGIHSCIMSGFKRSGAWWYEATSNQMLALRCAMYNGNL